MYITWEALEARRQAITPDEIWEALQGPSNFGCSVPEIGDTWALGPCIENRDSDALSRANSRSWQQIFRDMFPGGPCWDEEGEAQDPWAGWHVLRASHWGFGWTEHLSFRAVDAAGEPTLQFALALAIRDALADYPVMDEEALWEEEEEDLRYLLEDRVNTAENREWVPVGNEEEDAALLRSALREEHHRTGEVPDGQDLKEVCARLWPGLFCRCGDPFSTCGGDGCCVCSGVGCTRELRDSRYTLCPTCAQQVETELKEMEEDRDRGLQILLDCGTGMEALAMLVESWPEGEWGRFREEVLRRLQSGQDLISLAFGGRSGDPIPEVASIPWTEDHAWVVDCAKARLL